MNTEKQNSSIETPSSQGGVIGSNSNSCRKSGFKTHEKAQKRASEIYKETKKSLLMRAYKCKDCELFHLTKMTKHKHKFSTDSNYRKDVKTKSFIKRESEYWSNKLGVVE